MVIDGMSSYSTAAAELGMYRDFFHAIVAYSKQRLMTTFFNYENPEFLGISSYMPDFPLSSIVDNIVLLSLVEINNSLHRCISVVKSRGSNHSFDTREFVIGQGGISLVTLEQNVAPAIPLQRYSSLLGRAPTRFSRPEQINGSDTFQDPA
jgi:circadian clock protein KaiC